LKLRYSPYGTNYIFETTLLPIYDLFEVCFVRSKILAGNKTGRPLKNVPWGQIDQVLSIVKRFYRTRMKNNIKYPEKYQLSLRKRFCNLS
jgi:hypothetical protein